MLVRVYVYVLYVEEVRRRAARSAVGGRHTAHSHSPRARLPRFSAPTCTCHAWRGCSLLTQDESRVSCAHDDVCTHTHTHTCASKVTLLYNAVHTYTRTHSLSSAHRCAPPPLAPARLPAPRLLRLGAGPGRAAPATARRTQCLRSHEGVRKSSPSYASHHIIIYVIC
jgi:hypothetical protein